MKLVIDAIGVRPGSAAIVISNTLLGWASQFPDDELIVLSDGPPQFRTPPGTSVMRLVPGTAGRLRRLWAQSWGVRRMCRRIGADALLSAVTASSMLGSHCPHGTIVYDLRHELRPDQFSRQRRWERRVLYGWSFRRSDALFCISERTRRDLIGPRPQLSTKSLATPLGADHAAHWKPSRAQDRRFVLAFGHFANKNVDSVIRAFATAAARHPELDLHISGMGKQAQRDTASLIAELDIQPRVRMLPWLTDDAFEAMFAGAAAIVFPSDFEGFGLPAVEAMLLRVPVVVSTDPALAEVTAGHAVVAADGQPSTLAAALDEALGRSPRQIEAAHVHALTFTWARTAAQMRAALLGVA